MEALDFLKEYKRMCSNCSHFCDGCPLKGEQCLSTGIHNKTDGEFLTITSTVEQWSKEHPIMTNAQKFKEVFGACGNTVNRVKPEKGIAGTIGSCGYYECRESCGARHFPRCPMWWDDGYEEPEHDG